MTIIIKTIQGYEGSLTNINVEDAPNIIAGINFSKLNNQTTTFNFNDSEITINSTDIVSIEFLY